MTVPKCSIGNDQRYIIDIAEEAMSARCGVLVHCVAGVSRSVTVTLAYLMQRHRLCLRDAFELVRSRKTDIAPNFHFMRQLHSFERDLGLHEHSATLSKVCYVLPYRRTPHHTTPRRTHPTLHHTRLCPNAGPCVDAD